MNHIKEQIEKYKSLEFLNKVRIWQILCFILIGIAYSQIIGPRLKHMGFIVQFDFVKLLIAILIFGLFLNLLDYIKNDFMLLVFNIIFVYQFSSELVYFIFTPNYHYAQLVSVGLVLILLTLGSWVKGTLRVNRDFENERITEGISYLMFAPFVVLYYKYIDLSNLINRNVYETRMLFREVTVPLTGYLMAPLARVLLPSLMVNNFKKSKYLKVLLFVLMITFLYLCGALKSVYVGLFAAILFYFGTYKDKILYSLKFITILIVAGLLVYFVLDKIVLLDLPVRRVFIVPPYLNTIYNNFFDGNFTYLSHSPFGLGLVEPNFTGSLPRYIGEVVIGQADLSANVGVYTEGFFSLGLLGTLLFSFIIAAVFLFLKLIRIKPEYFGLVFVYIYYLNTAMLSTLLLTHGLAFFLVYSYFFLGDNKTVDDQKKAREMS